MNSLEYQMIFSGIKLDMCHQFYPSRIHNIVCWIEWVIRGNEHLFWIKESFNDNIIYFSLIWRITVVSLYPLLIVWILRRAIHHIHIELTGDKTENSKSYKKAPSIDSKLSFFKYFGQFWNC